MNLQQLREFPSAVYECDRKQAFRPTVSLSISNEDAIFCKFRTPRNNGRDESRVERVRSLGGSAGYRYGSDSDRMK